MEHRGLHKCSPRASSAPPSCTAVEPTANSRMAYLMPWSAGALGRNLFTDQLYWGGCVWIADIPPIACKGPGDENSWGRLGFTGYIWFSSRRLALQGARCEWQRRAQTVSYITDALCGQLQAFGEWVGVGLFFVWLCVCMGKCGSVRMVCACVNGFVRSGWVCCWAECLCQWWAHTL